MEARKVPHSSLAITPVSLGTMIFGEQLGEAASHDLLDSAVKEYGINMIDTAELYPVPCKPQTSGATDRIIGSWLKKNPSLRSQLVITTKVIAYSQHFNWFRGGPKPTREQFQQSLDDSLARLGLDEVDVLLIHWPARNTVTFGSLSFDPTSEHKDLEDQGCNFSMQAQFMADMIKAGKIKSWGLSNETTYGVMKFLKVCEEQGLPKPSLLQNAYSLLNRTFEAELWETCYRENIGLLPYSSLAMGHLSGKYLPSAGELPKEDYRLKLYPILSGRYAKPQVEQAVEAYHHLAEKHGLELITLALAFVHQRPFVTSNILGVRTPEQLKKNMSALSTTLSEDLLQEINHIHQMIPNPAP